MLKKKNTAKSQSRDKQQSSSESAIEPNLSSSSEAKGEAKGELKKKSKKPTPFLVAPKETTNVEKKVSVYEKMLEVRKNTQKEESAKIKKQIKKTKKWDFEITHSYTDSSCSFEPKRLEKHEILANDNRYQIRLEKLLPKNLRRRRYQKVPDDIAEQRAEFYAKVSKNPEEYAKTPGIRTFLIQSAKKKIKTSEGTTRRKHKNVVTNHPWIALLTAEQKALPKEQREVHIRTKYNEIINSTTLDDDIAFDNSLIDFVRWYEKRKAGTIVESDISSDTIFNRGRKKKSSSSEPTELPPSKYDDESS